MEKQNLQGTTVNLKADVTTLRDVDDVLSSSRTEAVRQQGPGSKLAHAKETGKKTEMELRQLCEGLDNKISEIGIVVSQAQTFQGSEKFYNVMGHFGMKWAKDKAAVMRHDRLQTLDLRQAVQEIQNYVVETINQIGESEQEYKMDLGMYQAKLDDVLHKQKVAMPEYLTIQAKRQELEGKVQAIDEELKAGTLDQSERPAKEQEYENAQRELQAAQLQEKTLLATVKEAKEAIPELQKNRDAASNSIQALHGMRQGMFEKFSNLKVVLERATTAMKANARMELYSSVDPAFNKAIEAITSNNVATAGAALETWAERIKHAAIDPERSQQLLNELVGHISDAAKDLQDVENSVKAGKAPVAAPLANGKDTSHDLFN